MTGIKYLFWNINQKNLVQELIEIVLRNNIDILMAVEAEKLDIQHFISQLRRKNRFFEKKEILSKQNGIILLANTECMISTYKEEKHFTAYKIHEKNKNRLLIVVHLTSALHYSEAARDQRAGELSKTFEKLEEACNMEAKKEGLSPYATMIVGDFNLHPFSAGIIGAFGFHALMDTHQALKKSRMVDGNKVRFYYNPMWNLIGKKDKALGTYYYDTDQDDRLFYWYMFDQILLRPELIDEFDWNEFEIVDHIGNASLIKNHKINNTKYSDHLPVKFAVGQEVIL